MTIHVAVVWDVKQQNQQTNVTQVFLIYLPQITYLQQMSPIYLPKISHDVETVFGVCKQHMANMDDARKAAVCSFPGITHSSVDILR